MQLVLPLEPGSCDIKHATHSCLSAAVLLAYAANVFRDGQRITLDADKLVPGDIVAIKSGDRLPADMRLLQVSNLQVRHGYSWPHWYWC
jgi:P-type E1-E2 ATPase